MSTKTGSTEGQTFTLEDLERARAEERDKLYPQLSKTDERTKAMAEELKSLRDFQKKAEKEAAAREAQVADAAKAREEAELSAKELIEKRTAEMAAQVEAVRQQQETERALFAKEREFAKTQLYVRDRMAQESDNIAPELYDYIGGETVEEIEASIERAKAKTESIVQGMAAAQQAARASQPGVRTGPPAITPMDQPASQELTGDDISKMSWAEYAKFRTQAGMGGSGQGLFG
jgi:hypothetical protein